MFDCDSLLRKTFKDIPSPPHHRYVTKVATSSRSYFSWPSSEQCPNIALLEKCQCTEDMKAANEESKGK